MIGRSRRKDYYSKKLLIKGMVIYLIFLSAISCSTSLPEYKKTQDKISPQELLYIQAKLNASLIIRFLTELHEAEKKFGISTPSSFDISGAPGINRSLTKLYGQFAIAVEQRYPNQSSLILSYGHNYGQLYLAILNYITNHLRSIYSNIPPGDKKWLALAKADLMLEALNIACHELDRPNFNYIINTFDILDLVSQFLKHTGPAYSLLALKLTQTFFDPPEGLSSNSAWYTPTKEQLLISFLRRDYQEVDQILVTSQNIQRVVCAVHFFSLYRYLIIPEGNSSFEKNPYKFRLKADSEQVFLFYEIYAYAPKLISIMPPASTKNLGQKGEISFDFKTGRIVLYY